MSRKKFKVQFVHMNGINEKEEGISYLHCMKCLAEKPADVSPRDWARFSVATTAHGIQVWCVRHNINVDHVKVYGPDDPQAGVPLTNTCKHEE